MVKKLLAISVFFSFFMFLVVSIGYHNLKKWAGVPQYIQNPTTVIFPKGTRLVELSGVLESKGVIDDALRFSLLVRVKGNYKQFQSGTYQFQHEVSPLEVMSKIVSGKIHVPIKVQYVIPEGFTLKQIAARLEANKVGSQKAIEATMRDKKFLKTLKINADSAEGYIYPATYSYSRFPGPRSAIKKMVDTFWERLPGDYVENAKSMGLSLHEAVTFASLIELETMHEDEMPMVSEVIWARLKNKEPIGIDAAIIYGIKDYDGDITWKHLQDRKNNYNTRIHKGLPPGPIGSPSPSSLNAVLTPTNKGYYYYVLNADQKKRHHFSKTLREHNQHVKRLIKASKKN